MLAGGGTPDPARAARLLDRPLHRVIAADSGVELAPSLGVVVDLVVGDLDSASPVALEEAERAGARIERFSEAKDFTDLELALEAALELAGEGGPGEVLVLGGVGERLDHLAGELLLLGAERWASLTVTALLGPAVVTVVRAEPRTLVGTPDDLVTLLALHGPAEGVTTSGLAYPLFGERLAPGSSRGVSNVLLGRTAEVAVAEAGVVLALQPGGGTPDFP